MPLDFNEIRQLLTTIAQTDIAEVTLKSDDFELTVRKSVSVSNQIVPIAPAPLSGVVGSGLPSAVPIVTQVTPNLSPEAGTNRISDSTATSSGSQPGGKIIDQKLAEVPSPMVGTFYRAPAPGEAPFVEVGDRIRQGQTVCIIEAMKLMNEIEADISGQVIEILVQNGEPVEYNQPLMRIKPD
ncbi:acetyl-CoA carboxylase biotin carboxyl carrier protein [Anabaena subtropica]|uniref:Biotin carboxyl carrier protein of acetyl-CoA carboxylase n=1 Tax=Anabaena subtropica FACHB-260 TaxID=2692884 RepID=A0ABR8CT17_9NOST|nr:acetyl-CoA carboxylase biotin carboxyl carrier protein [Anabaena subtropica]MBD2346352.1 acetyl-CoA carboxylase biotin carboxyl carrier protein [Anabaena subtropica FACHB-260]